MIGLGTRICVRLDTTGKEINQFVVPNLATGVTSSIGGLEVTPKGNILIVHSDSTVVEYDADGKAVWKANVVGNRATRLANGNTLIASETKGVVELDGAGKNVWRNINRRRAIRRSGAIAKIVDRHRFALPGENAHERGGA